MAFLPSQKRPFRVATSTIGGRLTDAAARSARVAVAYTGVERIAATAIADARIFTSLSYRKG
jgi:hypothetical protein